MSYDVLEQNIPFEKAKLWLLVSSPDGLSKIQKAVVFTHDPARGVDFFEIETIGSPSTKKRYVLDSQALMRFLEASQEVPMGKDATINDPTKPGVDW